MRRITTHLMTALGAILVLLTACNNNSFMVKGVVSGANGQVMFLENVGVSSVETLDSVKLNAAGKFLFKQSRPQYPDFYRLRLNNQLINFSIDSTETVSFNADAGTFATSYIVEGSENSKAIKQITLAQLDANQAIGRLRKDYDSKLISDTTYREQVLEAAEAYKEVARRYIYSAPMSTAAYYALFQQIDGLYFFNLYDKDDSKAYGAVATSYDFNYPESARAKHLHNLALQSIKVIRQQRALDTEETVNVQEINYLDITLPNLYGETVKLSEVAEGKTVLVNFTAYQSEWSPALNMDFADLYEKYNTKGFTIYQVSLDIDKHFWKNVASKLPWTCVHDPEAAYSQIAALYNVKQLPALFLINKKGEIVKRIEDLRTLDEDVSKAVR
ncbi:MAG: AhpC/TSA family protein [Tannerellaceae bacterium]|nr:AhpC/TSA family protein [Tannerellaceae bacterium]